MRSTGACFSLAAKAAFALRLGLGPGQTAYPIYDVKPGEIAGKPGSITRVWPLEGGGPGGGDAFRILYRSTGLNGEPIAVSGAIFIPPGPAPERGRKRVRMALAWMGERFRGVCALGLRTLAHAIVREAASSRF